MSSKSAKVFAGSVAVCAVLEHPFSVRAAVQGKRPALGLLAPRIIIELRVAHDGNHVFDRQAVVFHIVLQNTAGHNPLREGKIMVCVIVQVFDRKAVRPRVVAHRLTGRLDLAVREPR